MLEFILWTLLALFILIFIVPLFIPLILRVNWQGTGVPEWSFHFGWILIAPGGKEQLDLFMERSGKVFKKIWIVLRPLYLLISYILKGIVLLLGAIFKAIGWTFRLVRKPFKRKKREVFSAEHPKHAPSKSPSDPDSRTNLDEKEPPVEEDSETARATDEDDIEIKHKEDHEKIEFPEPAEEPHTDDSNDEIAEQSDSFNGGEQSEGQSPKPSHMEGEEKDTNSARFWKKVEKGAETTRVLIRYYDTHGSTIKRILLLLIRLLRGFLKAFNFRKLEATLHAGGDPATMGEILGWYHALDGATGGVLLKRIKFYPDFENHEFEISGSCELHLRVQLYKLVTPGLFLLVQLPYVKLWRIYKDVRKDF
ncbi:hypothetical protein K8I28_00530 [bacterium]|nr:hypothetical protein [bacterium]